MSKSKAGGERENTLGWFKVNLENKRIKPHPGILIWCNGSEGNELPDLELELETTDPEVGFFVSTMKIHNPVFPERAEMAKRILAAISDDPDSLAKLLSALRAFLVEKGSC